MRRETPENQQHQCYGTGTRVEVHRSRHELERVLHNYGADEVLFVEADANASIQFAMHGRYVQLALPLPHPHDSRFTHTPSGKARTASAQERAYDQALREHWRSLVVAVRGKLQSVESGISTFEQEFDRFLVPQFADEKRKRDRKAPKAVNWLLGGSHTIAIALVAAFLVPASAVGAFALPTSVVGNLAAPFRSAETESAAAGQGGSGLALARGGWSPVNGSESSSPANADHLLALRSQFDDGSEVRREASLSSPPVDLGGAAPAAQPALASAGAPTPIPSPTPPPAAPPSPPSPPSRPAPPASDEPKNSAPPADAPAADDTPAAPPVDSGDSAPADVPPATDDSSAPPDDSSSDDSSSSASADQPGDVSAPDTGAPPAPANDPAPGNGNGNGNGNNGTPPGQSNTPPGQSNTPPGQSGNTPPAQGSNNPPGNGNGNGNGNANGQNGTQGQGNGQKAGGKAKGGK